MKILVSMLKDDKEALENVLGQRCWYCGVTNYIQKYRQLYESN